MAQQTAVEFYEQALRKGLMGTVEWDPNQTLEQANQMFQEQIKKAFDTEWSKEIRTGEQYYNETYKNK
jgi:hypothetical protein